MKKQDTLNQNQNEDVKKVTAEAVVGVFETTDAAKSAISKLKATDVEFAEVSHDLSDQTDDPRSEVYRLFYSDTNSVDSSDVGGGVVKGAAVGAATGLLFVAVPVLGIIASIGGMLGGALIGGMAGIDEANRRSALPKLDDYRKMIREGKGLVIIAGDEALRTRIGNELTALNAEAIFQHPPILHAFDSSAPKPKPGT